MMNNSSFLTQVEDDGSSVESPYQDNQPPVYREEDDELVDDEEDERERKGDQEEDAVLIDSDGEDNPEDSLMPLIDEKDVATINTKDDLKSKLTDDDDEEDDEDEEDPRILMIDGITGHGDNFAIPPLPHASPKLQQRQQEQQQQSQKKKRPTNNNSNNQNNNHFSAFTSSRPSNNTSASHSSKKSFPHSPSSHNNKQSQVLPPLTSFFKPFLSQYEEKLHNAFQQTQQDFYHSFQTILQQTQVYYEKKLSLKDEEITTMKKNYQDLLFTKESQISNLENIQAKEKERFLFLQNQWIERKFLINKKYSSLFSLKSCFQEWKIYLKQQKEIQKREMLVMKLMKMNLMKKYFYFLVHYFKMNQKQLEINELKFKYESLSSEVSLFFFFSSFHSMVSNSSLCRIL